MECHVKYYQIHLIEPDSRKRHHFILSPDSWKLNHLPSSWKIKSQEPGKKLM
jgi:hypothetical protein